MPKPAKPRPPKSMQSTMPTPHSSPPPKPEPEFYGRESFEEVSLFQVLLGYGIPTLFCIALATFCFARRDL